MKKLVLILGLLSSFTALAMDEPRQQSLEVHQNKNTKYFVHANKLFPFNLNDKEAFTTSTFKELIEDSQIPVAVAVVFSGEGKYVHFYDFVEYHKYIKLKSPQGKEKGVENPINRQPIVVSYTIFLNKDDTFFYQQPELSLLDRGPELLDGEASKSSIPSWINFSYLIIEIAERQKDIFQKLNVLLLAQRFAKAGKKNLETITLDKMEEGYFKRIVLNAQNKIKQLLKQLISPDRLYLQQAIKDSQEILKE